MKRTLGTLAVAVAALAAATGPEPQSEPAELFVYKITAVKRHLFLATPEGEQRLSEGDEARSGDSLRTGSRSSADLEVPERATRFHIGTKTTFRLAHETPGVLIDVERGSLRAIFGKLPEGDDRERLVTTPSAVLAVRGTEYGVEVEKDGDTSVVVFEGTVEVRDSAGLHDSVAVPAGQSTRIRKGRGPKSPTPHELTAGDWDNGRRSQRAGRGAGAQAPGSAGEGRQGSGTAQPPSTRGSGSGRHGG